MKELRDYQKIAISAISVAYQQKGIRKIMYVLPTGGGKTAIFSMLIKAAERNGVNCAVICPLIELVSQTKEVLSANGVNAEVVTPNSFNPADYGFVVFDEAHHIAAETWLSILEKCTGMVLAVTATPFRLDGLPIINLFDFTFFGPKAKELIEDGHVSFPDVWIPESKKPFSSDVVDEYKKNHSGKKMIAFTRTKKEAISLREKFKESGVLSETLLSSDSARKRKKVIDDYKYSLIKVICTCGVIGEGFDVPDTDGVILLAKTKSKTKYLQQAGRALRPSRSKDVGVILDAACNSILHGSPADYDPASEVYLIVRREEERKSNSITNKMSIDPHKFRQLYSYDRITRTWFPDENSQPEADSIFIDCSVYGDSSNIKPDEPVKMIRLSPAEYIESAVSILRARRNRFGDFSEEFHRSIAKMLEASQ